MTSDLVQRAQSGDRDAFEALIRAAYDRLFSTADRILRDRESAQDAVQDAVVRCWRDLRGLRDPHRFDAWLYRLLVNACRDHARRTRRRPTIGFTDGMDGPVHDGGFAAIVEHDALERAFLTLPLDQRVALVLAHYAGYSAPDIATIVGAPVGTVYSRLHYGARAMRAALSPTGPNAATTTESVR
jgi:RNA polymerase sigma-70 factor (ECF subfamily)